MKLFERTGGHWLFWCGAIYLTIGLYCAIYYKEIPTAAIQLPWLLAISGPLLFPPLGRWLNLDISWDKKMFNWFGKKDKSSNVVPFPEKKETTSGYTMPEEPKEKDPHTFYRLGITDNRRISFQMGYSEITMNYNGVNDMIKQLEVFRDQIKSVPEETEAD